MKRAILVGAIATAIILAGVGAYAFADSQNVTVSAQVNPKFSMTLTGDGAVNFGTVDLGAVYAPGSEDQVIEVKSNKLWDYSSTQTVITAGAASFPFSTYITDTGTTAFGVGKPRGVTTDTRSYQLDLSHDNAYDIPANTPLTASVTYTAVQQ